jgi:hypothetical protein
VTGGRDGAVKVWDPRQKDEPVASLEPKDAETARDCWSVAFGNRCGGVQGSAPLRTFCVLVSMRFISQHFFIN